MKSNVLFVLFFLFVISSAFAQAPEKINYQVVIRDNNGDIKANSPVKIVVNILKGDIKGTSVFEEKHNVTTNSNGVVNLKIGSINKNISKINWHSDSYFINVNIDDEDIGTSQLISVPFALYSNYAGKLVPEEQKPFDLVEAISKSDFIEIPSGTYEFSSQIDIPSGKTIRGVNGKTILKFNSTAGIGLNIGASNDVVIENLIIKGSYPDVPANSGLDPIDGGVIDSYSDAYFEKNKGLSNGVLNPQVGIRINGGERIRINGCEIKNFSSYGIHVSLSGKNYRYSIQINDNYINNNYCGIKTDKEAERMVINGNYITLNQIGFYMDSGTSMIDNTAFNANRVGMVLADGLNHAHGVISNCPFTHCSLYGLVAYKIQFGQLFNACKFGYGDVYLYKSKGICLSACQLINVSITADGKWGNGKLEAGINIIHNCYVSQTVNLNKINGGNFDLKNNINFDGFNSSYLNN